MICRNWIKATTLGLLTSLLLVGCASGPQQATFEEATETSVWVCDDQDVMQTRHTDNQLWLQLPNSDSWLELNRGRSASGSLYENAQDTRFWSQGERARVFTPHQEWSFCHLEARGAHDEVDATALIAGTDNSPDALTLRATGHHPGWLLEIRQKGEGSLSFNFGTETHDLTGIEQTHQDLIVRRYQAQLPDGEPFQYQVENVMCIDIKSGEPFQHRVEMTFQGQTYRGCGQSF
ncbi:Membrane-bound lysozyme-inhibitor of c-type lysozyme [Marinospirillum celere]|uniref:Membrane-bound lysozyme-inhibitor of c-type lysozyme n=1 Tax=Marinospirillum celere TaxID=1122252 RepID=A0A1I1IR79_9GAMM|nr:MliC family protein [Marinospirillum celere]SFC38769.1 Membrane-bound lysozyme-inhibitor of c-type lysozyme [Marinospirillum celere]